jgi:drug/metabolite transporter superfamily protein YnfA
MSMISPKNYWICTLALVAIFCAGDFVGHPANAAADWTSWLMVAVAIVAVVFSIWRSSNSKQSHVFHPAYVFERAPLMVSSVVTDLVAIAIQSRDVSTIGLGLYIAQGLLWIIQGEDAQEDEPKLFEKAVASSGDSIRAMES